MRVQKRRTTVFTGLAPNTERDDVLLALGLLVRPWLWLEGRSVEQLEKTFREWLPVKHAFAFESGRTGLFSILTTLGLERDDEVLLQAYTCVAVPNAVLWAGARPVYVDVEATTFNMSPDDLERKITPKSKALIIQHTFGNPADLDRLTVIAQRHGLFVIEDCAHALGSVPRCARDDKTFGAERRLGTFGDAAFFSFGRDKVISSVFGGLVTTRRDDTAELLRRLQASYPLPGRGWTAQQIAHPIITSLAKATYGIAGLGKLIIATAKRLRLISKAVTRGERRGERPSFTGHRLPNALAALALHQFEKLERFNGHRRMIAEAYRQEFSRASAHGTDHAVGLPTETPGSRHVFLRYTVRTAKAAQIRRAAKQEGILLGDWYDVPIAPPGVDNDSVLYRSGSCPMAERLARESLNLPTDIHITEDDARRIASLVIRSL